MAARMDVLLTTMLLDQVEIPVNVKAVVRYGDKEKVFGSGYHRISFVEKVKLQC